METLAYVLFTFAVGVIGFWFGEKYGKAFVAQVVAIELEAVSYEKSVGAMYQRIKSAVEKHL